MRPSIVRTVVPMVVGGLASVLLTMGIETPEAVQEWLGEVLTLLLGAAYYALARWLESRGITWPLLGSRSQPTYQPRHAEED